MGGHDVEGGLCACRTSPMSFNTLRMLTVGAVGILSVFILLWMMMEHFRTQACSGLREPYEVYNHMRVPPDAAAVANLSVAKPKEWDYDWDKKSLKTSDEQKAAGVRSILLVRHGQYDLATGHLTELGRKQANLTGRRIQEMNVGPRVIIHSTLDRAVETAQIIHSSLRQVPMQADDMLREGGPIPPKPTITYWGLPERDYFVDGPRLEAAFRKYFFRHDKQQTAQTFEILVGHGNIFRFFALRALQLQSSAWMRVFIAHASLTMIHINPDSTVSMTKFGDAGHFPSFMVTY